MASATGGGNSEHLRYGGVANVAASHVSGNARTTGYGQRAPASSHGGGSASTGTQRVQARHMNMQNRQH